MRVLGLCGGHHGLTDIVPGWSGHDAAAVLVEDGEVLAAVEEERVGRVKHASWFPVGATAACMRQTGLSLSDVDVFAFPWADKTVATDRGPRNLQEVLESLVSDKLGVDGTGRVRLLGHHFSHALSAVAQSPFQDCIVGVFDGSGDGHSGGVYEARGGGLHLRASLSVDQSLGEFYTEAIGLIGFSRFEEYKAMGLAPYAEVQENVLDLSKCLTLLGHGDYRLDRAPLDQFRGGRKDGGPLRDWDAAFAAGLQRLLVDAVQHVLGHHQRETSIKDLALAGGVAHNCSMNGVLARSGTWDRIFVQPAAHDAGAALGAALAVCQSAGEMTRSAPIRSVAWGLDIGSDTTVRNGLERWSPWVEVRHVASPAEAAAEALLADEIIGWVQGRAEFGPRALGHRSILADPRPAANRDRVNRRIKQREGFRPFAPAVPTDLLDNWFESVATEVDMSFMSFVAHVRPEYRQALAAITHVDGTARVQAVDRAVDPLFASLIRTFGLATGISVILNTSFNGPAEPIVDSVDDAVAGLLTLDLDRLVIGSYEVVPTAKSRGSTDVEGMCVSIPSHRIVSEGMISSTTNPVFGQVSTRVSALLADYLAQADGLTPLDSTHRTFLPELVDLWKRKIVDLAPPVSSG